MYDSDRSYRTGPPAGGIVYGLGLIGALVFYLQQAHSFWAILLAILKSLVWPALLVYHVLKAVELH